VIRVKKKLNTRRKVLIFCVIIIQSISSIEAQEIFNDSIVTFKPSFVALPLVFRSPETDWGFGAGAFYAFKFKKQSAQTRPSQIQIGFAYTLLNQVLSYIPFQFFTDENKFQISGELGYYRYIYDFYGVGNQIPIDYRETFDVVFPRVRVQVLNQLKPFHYAGLRYSRDDYQITRTEPDGFLGKQEVTGSRGNIVSSLGMVYQLDNRDNIFSTRKGWFVEALFAVNSTFLGSDLNYQKWILDARKFFPLSSKTELGINGYLEFSNGEVPFNQMALIGGTKRMRGYYEGRYRDNHMILFQSEYRFPVWWRFSGVFFGGVAAVAGNLNEFNPEYIRWSIGSGLRFALAKASRINLRLDFAVGKKSSGFYLTVGEAF
jgi:outer membrane protein assembly factor BamA